MKTKYKLIGGVIAVIICCLISRCANAATQEIREPTFSPAKQVTLMQWESGVVVDSIVSVAGTITDSSLALSNDSTIWRFVVDYDSTKTNQWVTYVLYENQTNVTSGDPIFYFPPTTASASISLADKQEIGGYANDSVTADHGPGAYDGGAGPALGDAITFFPIDTSAAPDDSLSEISIQVFNQSGTPIASGNTVGGIAVTVRLLPGTYTVAAGANVTRYNFDDTLIAVSGLDTFGIQGYAADAPQPSSPTMGPIWGDIGALIGSGPQIGVIVTLRTAPSTNVTASGVGLTYTVIGYDTTDVAGRFSFDVPISVATDDTVLYRVVGNFQKRPIFSIDSLFNPVGGVNITDSIGAR